MRILLVEDNDTLTNLFRVQLRRLGDHDLTIANTKQEALIAFKNNQYDLIFIDMALDGIQSRGIEILTEIKSVNPGQRIGVLSSNDIRDLVSQSKKLGAEFYMVKPFTLRGLKMVMTGDKEKIQNYQPEISEGRIIAL